MFGSFQVKDAGHFMFSHAAFWQKMPSIILNCQYKAIEP